MKTLKRLREELNLFYMLQFSLVFLAFAADIRASAVNKTFAGKTKKFVAGSTVLTVLIVSC